MSYCRFSNSDAYLFHHVDGYITCMGCSITPVFFHTKNKRGPDPSFYKRSDALIHLQRHVSAGHFINENAFSRLREEIENEGNFIQLKVKNRKAFVKRRKLFKKRIRRPSITRLNRLKQLSKSMNLISKL